LVSLGAATQAEWDALTLGIPALIVGIVWWARAKATYVIVFSASSGKIKALESKDQAYIDRALDAINRAVIDRG